METKIKDLYYNIDCVPYKVINQTDKILVIENFLGIDNLWGETELFSIDITGGILTLTLFDNNDYGFDESIGYLINYYSAIGTDMFDNRTLEK